jgi:FtsH-binding integral membrane protein
MYDRRFRSERKKEFRPFSQPTTMNIRQAKVRPWLLVYNYFKLTLIALFCFCFSSFPFLSFKLHYLSMPGWLLIFAG